MRKTNEQKTKHKIPNKNGGITLIALIVTIIVMLILVSVTISMAVNGGLFEKAGQAVSETKKAIDAEKKLASGAIKIGGTWYNSIDEYLNGGSTKTSYDILKEYFLGLDGKGLNIGTFLTDEESLTLKNNDVIPDASTSIAITLSSEDQEHLYMTVLYKGEEYILTINRNTKMTTELKMVEGDLKEFDIRNLKTKIIQTEGADLWSSTLTLKVDPDENLKLTLEQKREVFANICGYSSFELFEEQAETILEKNYEEAYTELGYNSEDDFLSEKIVEYSNLIDYKNIEQIEKAGVVVFKVQNPQGNYSYMTNLGGTATCGVSKNGSYTFSLISGQYTNSKTTTVSSIRKKDTQEPHQLILELSDEGYEILENAPVMYSIDGSDDWKLLNESLNISCNGSISFKNVEDYNKTNSGGASYQGTKYVEYDDAFYKYWLDGDQWYGTRGYDSTLIFMLPALLGMQGITEMRPYVIEPYIFAGAKASELGDMGDAQYIEYMNVIAYSASLGDAITEEDDAEIQKRIDKYCYRMKADANSSGELKVSATEPITIDITKDTYLYVSIEHCLTTDMYVEVLEWDEEKKKRIRKRKKIKDVTYDDELLVWDFDKGEFTTAKPLWIMKPKVTTKYNLLKFSDGSELKTINQHRIFNKEAGKFTYPMTDETPIGTTTYSAEGKEIKLISKEVIVKDVEYINIITKYHMNIFTNNILTSCRLSNLYPIENMKYVKDDRELIGKDKYSDIPEEYYYGLRLAEQPTEINRGNDEKHSNSISDYIKNLIYNAKI